MSSKTMSKNVVKDPGNEVHNENINNALQYLNNFPHDVSIISGDNEEIQTNKYLLSVFSPSLRNLLSSPLDTYQKIFLPDFPSLSIRNLLNIINSGFSLTDKISNDDIKEITETAQLMSVDIKELCNVENVPSQDTVSIGISIVEHKQNKFSRESAHDASWKIYDESSESVLDTLLRIFDDSNESVETNFTSDEIASIDNDTQMKDTVGVCGKKRKRSEVFKTKDSKYECYETSWPGDLRTHVESKHEGIRYTCDQCDYKATLKKDRKKHKESQHEGVRYPCDKCDYKATEKSKLRIHKESKHLGVCYSCDDCQYKASTPAHLRTHVESIHEGVRYPCDECDYKATERGSLKKHRKRKHLC